MIWVSDAFVRQNEEENIVEINVTNLMLHLCYSGERPKEKTADTSAKKCLLDAILEVEHSNKAFDIFQMEPEKKLVRDYWFVHQ